jgi:dihydropteridine reductase
MAPFQAVVCTAGGWAGGSLDDLDAAIDGAERMVDVCFKTSLTGECARWRCHCFQCAVAAAIVARSVLDSYGLFVLVGAAAAQTATPSMVGYGMCKSATHHLVKCAAAKGGLKEGQTAIGILPHTIDTPMNREGMPSADRSGWTKPEDIARKLVDLAEHPSKVDSGALLEPITKEGVTNSWRTI